MKILATTLIIMAASFLQAQNLYDPDQIALIEITFPQNNWDQLLDDLYAAGNGERLMATVEINGETFDSVGIRYRGGSSYNPANGKNPFNIKLDYLKNQDYQGYSVLKLGNGAKDPSWLREVLTLDLARQYMEAPQANYASVYVNGNFHGVYSNVESVNSDFFKDRFLSDPANTRFECNPTYDFNQLPNPPAGCTAGHGASLEYLGSGLVCYLNHYRIQSTTGWDELITLASLLKNFPQNARQTLDLDRFLWLLAFNNLTVNLNSYTGAGVRNYYLFKADNNHFVPVPDDVDGSFARFPWATVPQAGDPQPALGFYAQFPLFFGENNDSKPLLKAIFNNPTWKRMYTAHLRTMLDEVFTNGFFAQRAEILQSLVSDEVINDGNAFYTHDEFLENLSAKVVDSYTGEDAYGLTELMDTRAGFLLGLPELQAAPPAIGAPAASPALPAPGSNVTITAQVSNATAVWLGYRNNIKEVFSLAQMLDDGAHGDGAAGDGVYGAAVPIGVGGIQYYIYGENGVAGIFSPAQAEREFYSLAAAAGVAINEIMASNQTTAADQDGEFDDWVEIFNNTSASVDLAGWFLSDDPLVLNKWAFPAGTTLPAGGYLIVWCDDDELQSGLHTSFNLSSNGEDLMLVKPDLSIADVVVFGAQLTDISLGRCPNGIGTFRYMLPTFDADNSAGCLTAANEPVRQVVLDIFPNPAYSQLTLETAAPGEQAASFINILGQKTGEVNFSGSTSIDVSGWLPGLYFVEIEGVVVGRVVVAK